MYSSSRDLQPIVPVYNIIRNSCYNEHCFNLSRGSFLIEPRYTMLRARPGRRPQPPARAQLSRSRHNATRLEERFRVRPVVWNVMTCRFFCFFSSPDSSRLTVWLEFYGGLRVFTPLRNLFSIWTISFMLSIMAQLKPPSLTTTLHLQQR